MQHLGFGLMLDGKPQGVWPVPMPYAQWCRARYMRQHLDRNYEIVPVYAGDPVTLIGDQQPAKDSVSSGLQPIDTAPKDGSRILLYYGRGFCVCGSWDSDKLSRNPRPYWANDHHRTQAARQNPPTHWAPLPQINKEETA